MTKDAPRIPALDPESFTPEQKEAVGDWHVLNFSRVLANHPALYRAYVPFIEKVISHTDIPPRDREILCIRTLVKCGDVYELSHHETIARNKVDMTDAQIAAIKADGEGLSDFDKTLMQAADELVSDQRISDPAWEALARRYSTVELMEVVGLVGCYIALAMMTRSFEIQIEVNDASAEDELEALRQYT